MNADANKREKVALVKGEIVAFTMGLLKALMLENLELYL
jgi:hypothetical protein